MKSFKNLKFLFSGILICFISTNINAQSPGEPVGSGFQNFEPDEGFKCVSDEQRQIIFQEIENNIQMLKSEGRLFYNEALAPQTVQFIWPIKMADGVGYNQIWGISNFVDHQSGSGLLDFECFEKTYNGHQGTDIYLWPFSWYAMDHLQAEDIAAAEGQIVARFEGFNDRHCEMDGSQWNAIYLQHADGSITWYGHMKKNTVTPKVVGDMVSQGEFLGNPGSSGSSTGPHLHFEVYDSESQLIDPFAGSCNTWNSESWWATQKPHDNPKINAVLTHTELPVFPDCPQQEIPNLEDYFDPGQTVYPAVYLTDAPVGATLTLKIIRPDDSNLYNWDYVVEDQYNASYYYWIIVPDGQTGNWKWEVTLNGETVSHDFFVGVMGTNENQQNSLKIYPNPAGEFFHIQSENPIKKLQISDAQGAVLKELKDLEYYERIDIKSLPAGVYVIKAIDNKSKISTTKLIKK